jgi:hypothetical protein
MTTDTSATRNHVGMAARPMPEQGVGDPRRFNRQYAVFGAITLMASDREQAR